MVNGIANVAFVVAVAEQKDVIIRNICIMFKLLCSKRKSESKQIRWIDRAIIIYWQTHRW